jgi:hypothetical protein
MAFELTKETLNRDLSHLWQGFVLPVLPTQRLVSAVPVHHAETRNSF